MSEAAKEEPKKPKSAKISLKEIYPDAIEIFKFQPKSSGSIKDSAVVVLDTNALLVPYGLSSESLEGIEKVYTELVKQNRLFVPAHVAREFANERTGKLTELYQRLKQKMSKVQEIEIDNYPLLASVEAYEKLRKIETDIRELQGKQRSALKETIEHVQQWRADDRVSLLYGRLFTDGLIHEPELTEEFMQDLENRNNLKVAPGYKDSKKILNYEGDLVIWYTILDLGKRFKRSLIFVSGETKGDWFHRSDNEPIFLKYELVDEYRRASGGETFQLLKFSAFLKLLGANTKIVEEVQINEAQTQKASDRPAISSTLEFLIRQSVQTEAKQKGFEINELRNAEFQDVSDRTRFDLTYGLTDITGAGRTAAQVRVKGFCNEKFVALPRITVMTFRWDENGGGPKENNVFFSAGGSPS
jgi:hypothetical protein